MPLSLRIVALLTVVLTSRVKTQAADGQPPARPNILFIASDDLRDWVQHLGYEQGKKAN